VEGKSYLCFGRQGTSTTSQCSDMLWIKRFGPLNVVSSLRSNVVEAIIAALVVDRDATGSAYPPAQVDISILLEV
jgi:hypothetical protein